jgi:hypothetical protein
MPARSPRDFYLSCYDTREIHDDAAALG